MTKTITEYAVRVKGTQKYLPRSQRRDGRGGSHLEPIDFSLPRSEWFVNNRYSQNMQIRSYSTKAAAQNLLNSWLKGKYYGDEDGDIWIRTQENRNREDMEIVEITIILPS
jgi:hypothetical protein